MIKIQSMQIEQFRGIKKLQIRLDGNNFVVKGANGSGKSGIIDAIEFGLTGNITRLTGTGTGGVTIKSHAPHVDFKDSPVNAKVILDLLLPTGKTFKIERNVHAPAKPVLNPDNTETQQAMSFIANHPEFSLSRREILKFVLTEAGARAKEVQSLLKVEAIDKTRATFQTVFNSSLKDAKSAQVISEKTKSELITHLKITSLSKELILQVANDRRKLLGLRALNDFTSDTKLSEGILSATKDPKKSIPRSEAIIKIDNLLPLLTNVRKFPLVSEAISAIDKLEKDPELLTSLGKQSLFEIGLQYASDDSCPLCDIAWENANLLSHLKMKISKNKSAAEIKRTIELGANHMAQNLRSAGIDLEQIKKYAEILGLLDDARSINSAITLGKDAERILARPLEAIEEVDQILTGETFFNDALSQALSTIKAEVEKLPDLSAEEAAKQYLIVADEKITSYQNFKRDFFFKEKQEKKTAALLKSFTEISEKKLTGLYSEVQNNFSKYYSSLNKEDEANFTALLKPVEGALNFEVDFYGRGQFPPNAYHSEGHQDSMGLCLYFALAKKLLGNSFSICLLDDVLMSVDSGHRREVCRLLKSEFPDTQFVLTTHDEVWSKQLTLEGVVKSKNLLQFRSWTVNDGPSIWDIGETWAEIDDHLVKDNVSSAAHSLRRYLEFLFSELSFKLRARLEIRPVANYDLGELTPTAIHSLKEMLRKAKSAANSWGQSEIVSKINLIDESIGKKYQATNAEQWAVNNSLHYNEWAALSKQDFATVLKSFKDLLDDLKCLKCESWLYVSPSKGTPELLRCDCGEISFNTKHKD